MMKNIAIDRIRGQSIEKQKVEIVERKGLGHPDYIADSVAEAFSRSLSRYYIERFDRIFHHNVDKLEVIGGRTSPEFGGGKVLAPIAILFSGRATDNVNGTHIPVKDIAEESAREWIGGNIANLDAKSVRFLFETKSGSTNLTDLFFREDGVKSNDTSFGVGYSPLSDTEETVLSIEGLLNSKEFKNSHKFSGEDVKVMAVRKGDTINVTIAMAFVDRYVQSISDYFDKKAEIISILKKDFEETKLHRKIKIGLNELDERQRGKDGCYLTVSGTSSENGDDGAVGRGNRVNGLITPNRTMSMEAVAGKNPISHVGKLYNILALRLADNIHRSLDTDVEVRLVGKIGSPLSKPVMASINLGKKANSGEKIAASRIVEDGFNSIYLITKDILEEKIKIC